MMPWVQRTRRAGYGALIALSVAGLATPPVLADDLITDRKDPYIPAIWIDPDGCEHWVMDAGQRGFMDIRLDRQGNPICHRGKKCSEVPVDQLFASGSARIGTEGRKTLTAFFRSGGAPTYRVAGHTDSDGSDGYNMRLSNARAEAVAALARSVGAKVSSAAGYGERQPKASNATAAGKAQNRRVEIFCEK
ncbi:MAG: hypothetical protein RLZZ528_2102 [Pseudomonadota bacterium]